MYQSRIEKVLKSLKITNPVLLGKGGEGYVYEYDKDALKIYPRGTDLKYLENIQNFQRTLKDNLFTFATPEIFYLGMVDDVPYSVEKRLTGIQMDKKIIGVSTKDRQKMYLSYYNAIRQVGAITYPDSPFGQIIKTDGQLTANTWVDFLTSTVERKIEKTRSSISGKVINFDEKVDLYKDLIREYLQSEERKLVHSDYFLNNVLVNDDLEISAVLDFSVHAVVGDPKLDIAGVLTWNEIDPNIDRVDYEFLYEIAREDYGKEIAAYADLYLLFSSFYFSDMDDPTFSIKNLNDVSLWKKYGL